MPEASADEPKSPVEENVRLMFRQGGYSDAAEFLKAHLAENVSDVPAYELLADALRYSGDKRGAAAALARASELYAEAGRGIQSIAAQKRLGKLGVEPDFTIIRQLVGKAAQGRRVPTPLFDQMSDEEFAEIVDLLEPRTFEDGQLVVEEGGPGDAMYIVSRGALEVSMSDGDNQLHLADLGPGDFFGESALLSGKRRTASIRAKGHVECLVLSLDAYGSLVVRHPRVKQVMEEFNRNRAASTVSLLIKKKS
jgi:hypothetical protein